MQFSNCNDSQSFKITNILLQFTIVCDHRKLRLGHLLFAPSFLITWYLILINVLNAINAHNYSFASLFIIKLLALSRVRHELVTWHHLHKTHMKNTISHIVNSPTQIRTAKCLLVPGGAVMWRETSQLVAIGLKEKKLKIL